MVIRGQPVDLHAFHLVLSHSRMGAIVWSERADQLAWLHVHNEALRRLGGVPAVLRVDNVKTAVGRGAGPWGILNESYRLLRPGRALPHRRGATAHAAGQGQGRAAYRHPQAGLRSPAAGVGRRRAAPGLDRHRGAPAAPSGRCVR